MTGLSDGATECNREVWLWSDMCLSLFVVSSVQCPAVQRPRAADVSGLQLLSFIPLHVTARPFHVCGRPGIQPLSATKPTEQKNVRASLQMRKRLARISSSLHFTFIISLICCSSSISRSPCGPFGKGETLFNVTGVCVKSLPSPAQTTIRYLTSEAFALPLILAEM